MYQSSWQHIYNKDCILSGMRYQCLFWANDNYFSTCSVWRETILYIEWLIAVFVLLKIFSLSVEILTGRFYMLNNQCQWAVRYLHPITGLNFKPTCPVLIVKREIQIYFNIFQSYYFLFKLIDMERIQIPMIQYIFFLRGLNFGAVWQLGKELFLFGFCNLWNSKMLSHRFFILSLKL